MGSLHAHKEIDSTEDLNDDDGKTDPGDDPSPFHLRIGEERYDPDEERQEDDAHGGRLKSAAHQSRDQACFPRCHMDRIEEEVERDRR